MKNKYEKIIICGLNGAGKSTFGRALAKATGFKFADIEEYYFSPDDITYSSPKGKNEVSKLLYEDICSSENFIFSAIKGNYGEDVSRAFTLAVYLNVPKDVRLERVKIRSEKILGERMQTDDIIKQKENEFFHTVETRDVSIVTDWLINYDIPVIVLDGTLTTNEMVEVFTQIYNKIKQMSCSIYSSLNKSVSRINLMENYFDTLKREFDAERHILKNELWASDMRCVLTEYLESGSWLYDYTLDEAELLPKGMKRGVLSQDALYDLLSEMR